jgi:translation initiation factor 2 subunit 2
MQPPTKFDHTTLHLVSEEGREILSHHHNFSHHTSLLTIHSPPPQTPRHALHDPLDPSPTFLFFVLFNRKDRPRGLTPRCFSLPPEQAQIPAERKARKSVAFTDEQVVVDADGTVNMVTAADEPTKDSAVSHTPRTPPLSAALESFADAESQAAATDDAPPADDSGLDMSLLKKKKKKKVPKDEDGDAAGDDAGDAAGDDGGLDLSMKKKKKKKATKETTEEDDFAAKLKQLEVKDNEDEDGAAAPEQDGDMESGTGIWSHDETKSINYSLLLNRFFSQLQQKNPDHTLSGTKSYKIPPPQCMREGNRKTVFANIADISRRMKRSEEHLTAYLFAELGTIGSVDGSRRLVIKGRWTQAQIETVVRKYISTFCAPFPYFFFNLIQINLSLTHLIFVVEYVTCKTCKSPDTELSKGENRLYFVTCNNCGSRRSVTAIKTGFSAQVGKRRKMKA